jgi:hypothetical protein
VAGDVKKKTRRVLYAKFFHSIIQVLGVYEIKRISRYRIFYAIAEIQSLSLVIVNL